MTSRSVLAEMAATATFDNPEVNAQERLQGSRASFCTLHTGSSDFPLALP